MKNRRKLPDLKGREFNGRYFPKVKRVKAPPRNRIRQLLRSFIPLQNQGEFPDGEDENGTG